ncbi:MAG TPA: GNAT family N-acetyltransferase [Acidimicrobiales bacterium]
MSQGRAFTCFTGAGAHAAVSDGWSALGGEARFFYQEPDFVAGLAVLTADRPGAAWVRVDDDDGPLAVAAFEVERRTVAGVPVRTLRHLRVRGTPFADALVRPGADPAGLLEGMLGAVADSAVGRPHIVHLTRLRTGSPLLALARAWGCGDIAPEANGGTSVLDTSMGSADWEAGLSRNLRKSLRRWRNRWRAAGGADAQAMRTVDEVAGAFDAFVELEARGWKGDSAALANRPDDRALVRHHLLARAADGHASARLLGGADGRPVAAQLATTVGDTLVLHKIAYDEAAADVAPGNLLMADLLGDCCDDPAVARVDCCVVEPWHARWGATVEPSWQLLAHDRRTGQGLAAGAARRAAPLLGRVRRRAS